jgi:hypothetical protein|tara:strand:+ start:5440 stop:5925 length:486 start_codon:yes stop_codon:yes gene_type:complete
MSWTYKGETKKEITDFPPNSYGFIYVITHKPTNKKYIGKKVLYFSKKVKIGKKELAKMQGLVGRRPAYKLAIKESDWKNYYGSQKQLKQLLLESKASDFKREILKIVPNKKLLTYFETKYQFLYQVLEKPDEFFNDNILGKFYTKDFEEIEYEDPLEIKDC